MSPEPLEIRSRVRGAIALARMAAVILLFLGLAFLVGGVWLVAEGLGTTEPSYGISEAVAGVGAFAILIGALHVWAASLIWIGRDHGPGLGLGVIGTVFGGIAAGPTLRDTIALGSGSAGADVASLLLPVPYVIVLVGLIVVRRRSASEGLGRTDGDGH
jgi:hypothetical protein